MDDPGGAHRSGAVPGTLSGEQRNDLLRAKLSALVRDVDTEERSGQHPAAQTRGALTGVMQSGGSGFVLVDLGTPQAVAGAISWAASDDCDALTLFVDLDGAAAARYASYFTAGPSTTVREVAGASSVATSPDAVPTEVDAETPPGELLDMLAEHGLEVVIEHGVVRGELLGLEVARLVTWPTDAGGDGLLHLEVGVGRFDRDAIWAVRDGSDMAGALVDTVSMVKEYRRPGAPPHPLGRLRRERWLRTVLLKEPDLVGAVELEPVAMTTEPAGLKDVHPAGAVGRMDDGRPVVVVTSVGVDLSVVPLAADLRSRIDESARLVLAVPPSDLHPVLGRLGSMLRPAAEIVPVDVPW